MIQIGPYRLNNRLSLAPMAGVTDPPFRKLCRSLGASLTASEMLTCNVQLWDSKKSQRRLDHRNEPEPRIVQIVGGDAALLTTAAQRTVDAGAQIVDINMGCPAKKVCQKAAGSALLKDEILVSQLLHAVVKSVSVPITLKIRTGWDTAHRNGVRIAKIAEDCGIQALAVHGRTRACLFHGAAEYDTIRAIKQAVRIPVFANGDIDSPHKAQQVLQHTGADGLMIGRAAQGNPWLFQAIEQFLATGTIPTPPTAAAVHAMMRTHLCELYAFYGEAVGVRVARKHIGWYIKGHPSLQHFWHALMQPVTASSQLEAIAAFFAHPDNSFVMSQSTCFWRTHGAEEKN